MRFANGPCRSTSAPRAIRTRNSVLLTKSHVDAFAEELLSHRLGAREHQTLVEGRRGVDRSRKGRHALRIAYTEGTVLEAQALEVQTWYRGYDTVTFFCSTERFRSDLASESAELTHDSGRCLW